MPEAEKRTCVKMAVALMSAGELNRATTMLHSIIINETDPKELGFAYYNLGILSKIGAGNGLGTAYYCFNTAVKFYPNLAERVSKQLLECDSLAQRGLQKELHRR